MPHEKRILSVLQSLRRDLHRNPEISGEETGTAAKIVGFLEQFNPDRIAVNIGGNGLLAEYRGKTSGPTVMFRCELDALPIPEESDLEYRSNNPGKAHLCGHDGHMAMVAGLAFHLEREPPEAGRVVLLFQPAEENGKGGERVINDPAFREFAPDYIFAAHNLPGFPTGDVVLSGSHFSAASRGMSIRLVGKPSHAAEPEKGINPGYGMARMLIGFSDLLKIEEQFRDFTLVTPVHARLGRLAYGTSPGEGVINLTLRSYLDEDMKVLTGMLERIVNDIAASERLKATISYEEDFPATINDPGCNRIVRQAAQELKMKTVNMAQPFKWSEDFGHFTSGYRGALFGLGSGIDQPALHNHDFDFPDELIPVGIDLYKRIYQKILTA